MTITELVDLIHTSKAQAFLKDNLNDDPLQLILKNGAIAWKKEMASQIAWRQKLAKKLPEWTAHPKVLFPAGVSTEQSSSEATAKLKSRLLNGKKLLDITGGMGVDTYYLSQNFEQALYVEQKKELAVLAAHNFNTLGNTSIEIKQGNGIHFIADSEADMIYADPARRDLKNRKLTLLDSYEPDLLPHLDILIQNDRTTLIKTSPMLDINQACKQLKHVSEVWVISHKNECKEVIYMLTSISKVPLLKTFNILANGEVDEFTIEPASGTQAQLSDKTDTYIFEPNSSILKAQGTDALAQHYQIHKLHPNSNLLTNNQPIPAFPGKTFAKQDVLKPYHPSLQKGRFNIISRNYPDNAQKIGNVLKIKPSDTNYLLATQTLSGSYVFITAELLT